MHIRSLLAAAGIVSLFALADHAGATTLDPASLDGCAEMAAGASHASRLDVVRRVDHGRGNYEYWINADVKPAQKSYCRTHDGSVADFHSSNGSWLPGYALRPSPVARTVTFVEPRETPAASCAPGDFTPPSNTGASLRND